MGDIVVAVDHHAVEDMELDSIRELTVGRENTFCTLQMMRGNRCVRAARNYVYAVVATVAASAWIQGSRAF